MTDLKSMRKPKLSSSKRRWPKANSGNPFGCPLGNRNRANPSPEDSLDRAAGEIFGFCLQIAKVTKNRALLRRLHRMTETLPSMSFRKIVAMRNNRVGVVCAREPNLGDKSPRTPGCKEIKQ